jgi:hypothetical protein
VIDPDPIRYVVTWHYGVDGAPLSKVFVRESNALAFVGRMRSFRHHTFGRPRGFRIDRQAAADGNSSGGDSGAVAPAPSDAATVNTAGSDRWHVRTDTPKVVRLEQTAALAARLDLWQPAPDTEVVSALRAAAAHDLAVIWDRLPGVGWLARELAAHPLAWRRGAAE